MNIIEIDGYQCIWAEGLLFPRENAGKYMILQRKKEKNYLGSVIEELEKFWKEHKFDYYWNRTDDDK